MNKEPTNYVIVTVSQGLHFLGKFGDQERMYADQACGNRVELTDAWELVLIKQQMLSPSGAVTGMTSVATLLPFGISTGPLKSIYVTPTAFIDCGENSLNDKAAELIRSVSDGAQKQRAKDAGIELASSLVGMKHNFEG